MSGLPKQYADLNAGTSSMMESSMMEGDGFYTPDTAHTVPGVAVGSWPDKTEPSQLCRVCANPNDYLIPIFNGEGVEHNLSMKIQRHLPIEVRESDSLPVHICYQCATTLMAWHDLVTTCVEADKKLRELQEREEDDDDDKTAQFYEAPSMDSDTGEEPVVQPSTSTTVAKTKVVSSPPTTRKSLASKRPKQKTAPTRLSQRLPSKLLQPAKPKEDSERWHPTAPFSALHHVKCEPSTDRVSPPPMSQVSWYRTAQLDLSARPTKDRAEDRPTYECDHCGRILASRENMRVHLRIHTGERPFTCHICGKQFQAPSGIKRHLKEVHERIKDRGCDICGRKFANKRTLEDHRRIHTGERPFVCDLCGKTFKTSASLYVHNKSHSNVFPFPCSQCDRRFRAQSTLTLHILKHTGEKPHPCDICGKRFRLKYELGKHRLIHSENKPFVCIPCGHAFRLKKYLTNHNKTHHKEPAILPI